MSKYLYTSILIVFLLLADIVFCVTLLLAPSPETSYLIAISAISGLAIGALFIAHLRAWPYTPHVLVVVLVFGVALSSTPSYAQKNVIFSVLVPCVIAAALISPAWATGSFIASLIGSLLAVAVQSGGSFAALGPTVSLENFLSLCIIATSVVIASTIADTAQQKADQSARLAQEERDQVSRTSQELATVNQQLNEQLGQQRDLLNLLATLETTVVQLADGLLFAPIVGHIDTRRSKMLTTKLLNAVSEQRARLVVLDISGVSMIDTAVAKALLDMHTSIRLLGCSVVISGISANVAMTMTHLGIDLTDIDTVRSPQDALVEFTRSAARQETKGRMTQLRAS